MSDRGTELLAAVIAQPDADQPRLDYADHLQQQGDPQGEFIRLQVRLAQRINPARRAAARAREAQVLREHKKAFSANVSDVIGRDGRWAFSRGFVDEVRCRRPGFADECEALFAVEPIRRLHIRARGPDDVQTLLDAGLVGRLVTLALFGPIGSKGAELLAASDQLASVRKLNLSGCELDADAAAGLVDSPHFACDHLNLADNELGDDGATRIAAHAASGRIKHLILRANDIGDAGLVSLVGSPHLVGLKTLSLSSNDMGDQIELLTDDAVFPQLARLELNYVSLSDSLRDALRERWGARLHL